jgi:hypothetical protein
MDTCAGTLLPLPMITRMPDSDRVTEFGTLVCEGCAAHLAEWYIRLPTDPFVFSLCGGCAVTVGNVHKPH